MRHRTLQVVVVGLIVAAAAVWGAAVAAPAAHADRGDATRVAKTYTIPPGATAILRWTFEKPPTKAVVAKFQISRDKRHWRTLKTVTVAGSTKVVRTSWKAPSHAELRYFRFDAPSHRSNLVAIRVK